MPQAEAGVASARRAGRRRISGALEPLVAGM